MIQVYVTKMPKNEDECPFFNKAERKCNITDNACCLDTKTDCEHLLTLEFDFGDINE